MRFKCFLIAVLVETAKSKQLVEPVDEVTTRIVKEWGDGLDIQERFKWHVRTCKRDDMTRIVGIKLTY